MLTKYSDRKIKRILHRCKLPYFTIRGWIALGAIGILGGIIGGFLFALAVINISK